MLTKALLLCGSLSLAMITSTGHAAEPSQDPEAVRQEAVQLTNKLAGDVKKIAGGTQLERELLVMLEGGKQQIERSRGGKVRSAKREVIPTDKGSFVSAHVNRDHGKARGQVYFQDGKNHAMLSVSLGKTPGHLDSAPLGTKIEVSRNAPGPFGTDFQVITRDPVQGEKIVNVRAFGNGVLLQDTGTASLKQAANYDRKWTTHLHVGNFKMRLPSMYYTTELVARGVQKLRAKMARSRTNHR